MWISGRPQPCRVSRAGPTAWGRCSPRPTWSLASLSSRDELLLPQPNARARKATLQGFLQDIQAPYSTDAFSVDATREGGRCGHAPVWSVAVLVSGMVEAGRGDGAPQFEHEPPAPLSALISAPVTASRFSSNWVTVTPSLTHAV